jgi:Acetyltransferase (GNAT) family
MTMKEINNTNLGQFLVIVASENHFGYADTICNEMEMSAKARGTGIAKRSPEYLRAKMGEGKAIISLTKDGEWVGFCYIETWDHGKFVANSGLIVSPNFRKSGIATKIKEKAFALSRKKYPEAKIIGLTTSLAVMKINSELGYIPVPFSELPKDESFWKGCSSCVNFDILNRTNRAHCLCTGMKYDPSDIKIPNENDKSTFWDFITESNLYERWMKLKQKILLKGDDNPKKKKKEEMISEMVEY